MKKVLKATVMFLSLAAIAAGPVFAERDGIIASDAEYVDDYTIKGSVGYTDINPADRYGRIQVLVEIPSGTTAKWEISTDTGNIVWEFKKGKPRTVEYKGGYPVNYGTVPKTNLSKDMGGEGESVDVILIGAQQKRGAVVKAKLIGTLKIREGDGAIDDKLVAVAIGTPEYDVKSVDELNTRFDNIGLDVASWFANYKGPDSGMVVQGFGSAGEARKLFYATIRAYKLQNEKVAMIR